jgi:hypothetical protein
MRQAFVTVLSAGVLACLYAAPLAAQTVDFQRDVRPILAQHCFRCHGPAVQKRGLRLDVRASALEHRAVVPGNPGASKLLQRVQAEEEKRMPPAASGSRLTRGQIQTLGNWIARGAEYTTHWAFTKPSRAALPPVQQANWPRNPIDRFILARLEREGLQPSAEAGRETLIHRLFLDLIGLLPSPVEVEGFVRDPRPDAYEKLVDRLLASPHYGERRARNWLDLARYADSNGYTIDGPRSIWPWRDWVIASFNRNLPFDRFTIEQLAGDLLPNAIRDQLVATGFQRNTPFNEEGGVNPEQFRVERTVDRTNTMATVWLGLTAGCAQCHDHKFDPISQKEYYRLYAFFNSTDEPELALPAPEQEERLHELHADLDKARHQQSTGPRSAKELEKLLTELEKESFGSWRALYPKMITSQQGATFRVHDDRSVVVAGKAGDSDTYEVHAVAPETGKLMGVRLEDLTDPPLPSKGQAEANGGKLSAPELSFETDGVSHPFSRTVNAFRQAIFILQKPHPVREGQTFVLYLRFKRLQGEQPLGRFRLAVTLTSNRFLHLPLEAQLIIVNRLRRSPGDIEVLRQALRNLPLNSEQVSRLEMEIEAREAKVPATLILRPTSQPRPTFVQKRGDFLNPGEAVEPGTPAVLPPLENRQEASRVLSRSPGPSPSTRLHLAHWLVSSENPLTARVVMNRTWQHYFGKGIVETENDFGSQGALPSHPELLDWLACEFARQGWDIKYMDRLIVTSSTYRQSSQVRPELQARDPSNRLLARQERLRLEAEIIRDIALSASGLLNPAIGGPGVYPPQPPEIFAFTQNKHPWPESRGPDRYRRGLYTFIWRQSQHPLLATFDAPDAQTACTRRNRSNTPLQALHLANDPTFVEFAGALAKRIVANGPSDDAGRIDYAWKRCLSRVPTPPEAARLLKYLKEQRQVDPDQAWTMVARALLNLDEFITRE